MDAPTAEAGAGLGAFLKSRRGRLDPAAYGFATARRRTPGLRREEVAQRADVSAVWYTWLEQGRGGAPSTEVLGRLSEALALSAAEREHLFLLAQGRPPAQRWREPPGVSPALQRLLDSLETSPAMAKTAMGDVAAWNAAAAAVFFDFARLPPERRNMLRLMFLESGMRRAMPNWEATARRGLAAFRLHLARAGASEAASALLAELEAGSADFARLWAENDVGVMEEPVMVLDHPDVGLLRFETTSFLPEGRADLVVLVRTPLTREDAEGVRRLMARAG